MTTDYRSVSFRDADHHRTMKRVSRSATLGEVVDILNVAEALGADEVFVRGAWISIHGAGPFVLAFVRGRR